VFTNAVRNSVTDVRQEDIDGNDYSFRPSKSYWVNAGWIQEQWATHSLPQISINKVGNWTDREGRISASERYEGATYTVDVFGSGRNQRDTLVDEIKNGFYNNENRRSMERSGVKFDGFRWATDDIADEMLPQDVWRHTMAVGVFFMNSGR